MIILINMCAFVLLVGYNILYINPKTDKAQLILRSIIHALSVMLITNLLFVFVYQVILIVNIIVLLLAVLIYSCFYTHSKLFIHSLLMYYKHLLESVQATLTMYCNYFYKFTVLPRVQELMQTAWIRMRQRLTRRLIQIQAV